jgi:HAD superfamily hydrolase (TIGR01509 family)
VDDTATVLLDLDGTLVDSNYHHALAWHRALRRAGLDVLLTELHRAIGLGGDQVVARFAAGVEVPVHDWQLEEFAPLKAELRPTPGAAALVAGLAQAGATVVYATSGSPADVGDVRAVIGADEWVTAAVSSGEVAVSKPAPDIFELAMRRAGADASRTIVVGDSTWDVEAATAARLPCIGLTCGGISAAELTGAGAIAVYATPQALLDDLAGSPIGPLLR